MMTIEIKLDDVSKDEVDDIIDAIEFILDPDIRQLKFSTGPLSSVTTYVYDKQGKRLNGPDE